jgi:hypothetical protein
VVPCPTTRLTESTSGSAPAGLPSRYSRTWGPGGAQARRHHLLYPVKLRQVHGGDDLLPALPGGQRPVHQVVVGEVARRAPQLQRPAVIEALAAVQLDGVAELGGGPAAQQVGVQDLLRTRPGLLERAEWPRGPFQHRMSNNITD